MGAVYFVRHGESQANADGVLAGASESPLTLKGQKQANDEAVRIRTDALVFATIVSSSLSRALDTAKTIARECDYPESSIVIIDELKERDAGMFEGGSVTAYHSATSEEVVAAGGESIQRFADRIARANAMITTFAADGDVLVVAHDGTYRMSMCLAQQRPIDQMLTIEKPANGQVVPYPLTMSTGGRI